MAKLIFRIIALVILAVGFIFVLFGGAFIPENKYPTEIRSHKQIRIKLIGYIICGFAALIFLIIGLF